MTEPKNAGASEGEALLLAASYRRAMPVREVMACPSVFLKTSGYYVCPRCRTTLDREFVSFCDRCGQRLDWRNYKKAKVIYPGQGR